MALRTPKELNVALLRGGSSGEREISLASGEGARTALLDAGFQVTEFDPANKEDLVALIQGDFDVAFLALHGKGGEDGTIQGFLETVGLPYIGSGVWASSTAISKDRAKNVYARHGIPTPVSLVMETPTSYTVDELIEQVGTHCVVKAPTEGSALGVYICETPEQIAQAIDDVFAIDTKALVETFVAGDEFTIAVIGNEDARALPIIKIIPINSFYDFESKYAQGGSQHICPAPLSEELTATAKGLAEAAHKALGCRGLSRTDLILDDQNRFWVLETNTIPGMTTTSLLPDAARVDGIEFSELCCQLIECALGEELAR